MDIGLCNMGKTSMPQCLITLSSLLLFFCLYNSHAVKAATPQHYENILVTASHNPLPSSQVGSAYTIISKEEIKRRQAVLVSDLLLNVPSFAVSRSGGIGSQTQIRVRGAESNHLLVLIDGVEANDIASGDEYNFAHLLISNIERIEIIRGPQSALWGSDALAGVVNIITKKGQGSPIVSGYLEGGAFDTVHNGISLNGSVNKYHYSLSTEYLYSGGINIAEQGNEKDGYQNSTLSFRMGGQPLRGLDIDINGRHIQADSRFDDDSTGIARDEEANRDDTKQDYFRIHAEHTARRWKNTLGMALSNTTTDNFSKNMVSGNIDESNYRGKKIRFDYYSSLEIGTQPNISHLLTLGFDHERDLFSQRAPIIFGDPNQNQETQTNGVAGEYRINLWQKLFLSASGRYDHHSGFKDASTYRTTLAYQLPSIRFHASYGKGIKRPTFIEQFGFFPNSFVGNPDLKVERSESWDAGIEQTFWGDRLSLDITYFEARLEDEINGLDCSFSSTATFICTASNLAGISPRQGLELSLQAKFTDRLSMVAHYSWLNANAPDGFAEVRRPRNTANLNLNYAFANDRANINFNLSHIGSRRDLDFRQSPASRVTLHKYTLFDLSATYQLFENTDIYGRVINILDEDYSDVFSYHTPGRSGMIGIRQSFGL